MMNAEQQRITYSHHSSEPESIPNRSPLLTGIMALFCPVRAGMRCINVSLRRAYAIHLASALAGWFLIACIADMSDRKMMEGFPVTYIIDSGWMTIFNIIRDLERFPHETSVILLGFAVFTELGFIAIALAFSPWGARADERLRSSFRYAFQRTWLFTPAPVIGFLIFLLAMCGLSWAFPAYNPFSYPHGRDGYISVYIWFSIMNLLGYGLLLWIMSSYLRMQKAPRQYQPIEGPTLCESCGYDLTGNLMATSQEPERVHTGRCPECGQPLRLSLDPTTRPGIPLEQASKRIPIRGWLKTIWMAIFQARKLGGMLRLRSDSFPQRQLWIFFWLFASLIAGIGNIITWWNWTHYPVYPETIVAITLTPPIAFTLAYCAAFPLAILFNWKSPRNLLPAVHQGATCLSGYMLILTAVFWIQLITAERTDGFEQVVRYLVNQYRIGMEFIILPLFFGPITLGTVVYIFLLKRIISATRYSNR